MAKSGKIESTGLYQGGQTRLGVVLVLAGLVGVDCGPTQTSTASVPVSVAAIPASTQRNAGVTDTSTSSTATSSVTTVPPRTTEEVSTPVDLTEEFTRAALNTGLLDSYELSIDQESTTGNIELVI